MSYECMCHGDRYPVKDRQWCPMHEGKVCGCGQFCPRPPLNLGRNEAKRAKKAAKKAQIRRRG